MSNARKQWQASFLTGNNLKERITVYGETVKQIREAANQWIRDNRPNHFSNVVPENVKLEGDKGLYQFAYFHSDETSHEDYPYPGEPAQEGWYRVNKYVGWHNREKLVSFDSAVSDFINRIFTENGPEYQNTPIIDGKLQLHLIRSVMRVEGSGKEERVNELLDRGWHIISIDHYAEPDSKSVQSVYIMAHAQ